MDAKLVYVKTSSGDEAVRQSTRVVQRNLRMILVLIDGKLTVGDLATKIGNARMVEGAIRELENGGFIAPTMGGVLVTQEVRRGSKKNSQVSALSQFSTMGPKSVINIDAPDANSAASNFSSFGKPILPVSRNAADEPQRGDSRARREAIFDDERGDRRQGISRLKLILGGGFALVATVACVAVFYPYDRFKSGIEASASGFLQLPVHIGSVGLALTPWPQLRLASVTIGEPSDSRIDEVRISSPLSLLGSGPYMIPRVDISGANFSVQTLVSTGIFKLPVAKAGNDVVVRQIRLERAQVSVRDMALQDISGEIISKPDGSVEKASFQAVDRTLRFDATPTAEGVLLNIEGMGWKPVGSMVSFDALQAKGLLQSDRLVIQSLDTTFLGGILKGTWLINWSNGLAMSGDGSLSHLDSRRVSAAFVPSLSLEGGIAGSLQIRAVGRDWEGLWKNVEATLDVDVTRGILHGVDLGEAVRRGAGSVVHSGATKFDRLHALVTVNPRQVSGRNIQMDAGMLTAGGQFVAGSDRQIDANLSVNIQTSASTTRLPVRVSGKLPDLSVVGGK